MANSSALIQKLWSFCDTLRDDGVSYSDYMEQLTYLLFLKMADQYSTPPYNRKISIPQEYNWKSLLAKSGMPLEEHYFILLRELGKGDTILGQIFAKAQNKIQDPAKLHKLIKMIDAEDWVGMDTDVKGDIYEGLLQKNAEDIKSGAGQYFTPRPLIRAIVECMRLEPMKTIADPACGTGGFFLAAREYLSKQKLTNEQKEFLRKNTFKGWEIVPNTQRLCLMNLILHDIGDIDAAPPIMRVDSLLTKPAELFDYVLSNPPFGKKSTVKITVEEKDDEKKDEKKELTYQRDDFWVTTNNKQLNFIQHICSMLKEDGKAAIVVPDNVLFEGGVGESIRKTLLQSTDVHTIVRLPSGIFYAHGVKANVIFFDNKPKSDTPCTKEIWYYDLRTNIRFTMRNQQMKYADLLDFIDCYNPEKRHIRRETERFKKFTYEELIARDKTSLDIFWLKDDSSYDMENLPDPDVLALEIIENIESALAGFRTIVEMQTTKDE
ncbi:class I SAM-dependent DNA methyltransferase [Cytophagaceae bacterium DM2B3-1]|uniref:site-specific DNA-methyltransferase (adenine-specific) n=1 Tax=Xanthocytophaga flava TaxID=3048013 RepID=A0ABT7CYY6_9BACT|nr:class I SAM-dependent DNA methyltransferase [Xanthocytophaga flavus]MDJ1498881.1 class I SAM-dependent DNA methyltransferase [Xanthocytophaga flavus]